MTALLAACASRQRQDEMSAAAHRRAAERERAVAEAYATAAPVYAPAPASPSAPGGGGGMPGRWLAAGDRSLTTRAEMFDHLAHASEHEAMADKIEAFAAAECVSVPAGSRAACPLVAVASVEDLANGVRLHLRADQPLDEIVARMRCHLAFARAEGKLRTPDCPLYIGGIEIARAPDGSGIDLIASSKSVASEIRRRAHAYQR
jgi:hypothetical protein